MNVIRELPHVLAVINAATIVVLLRAYSLIRARDREGHRRTMFVAIGLGVAFLAVYLVYHAFAGLAKFGGYGAIRPIYFTLLAIHVFMAFVVAVLRPYREGQAVTGTVRRVSSGLVVPTARGEVKVSFHSAGNFAAVQTAARTWTLK